MLLALKSVNSVKTFSNREEMINLIKKWKPDYMVVGSDYKNKEVVGSEYVKELIFYTRIPNYSTTKILNYYSND